MRRYETVFILAPEMEEQEQNAFTEKLSGILKEKGGSIEKVDFWGKRTLAYPINKKTEGFYVCIYYQADGESVRELERVLRVSENVLRYLTVKVKEKKARKIDTKPEQSVQPVAE